MRAHTRLLSHLTSLAVARFSSEAKLARHQLPAKRWSPDIVISRNPGSGGRVIARQIARQLNWKLLDKEILFRLANELHLPPTEFTKVDEHPRNWLADTWNTLFNPNYVSDILYLKHLRRLLLQSAREGDIVIVGRGANHIIPPDKCLRVKITAPLPIRIANTAKFEHMTIEQARTKVTKVEDKRNRFIRQYFGKNPHSLTDYDLVVNTSLLGIRQARQLIISAYLAKFPSERRRLQNKL